LSLAARRSLAVLTALAAGILLMPAAARSQAPELRAAASFLIPGLGQAANGDYLEGGVHLGLTLVAAHQYNILVGQDDYIEPGDRIDDRRNIVVNRTTFESDLYGTALTDLSLYSAYGAYRDARLAMHNAGYATPAPHESLVEAAYAPFQWDYLSRVTTWVPLLLALYAVAAPPDSSNYVIVPQGGLTRDEIGAGFAFQYEMVAVGEEGFFRGVLNNGFSSAFGETWGLVTSSAVFGLAHTGQGTQASGLQAGVFGLYVGWLQQRNDYDIRQGIAIHFWWDFLLGLATLQQRKAEIGAPPVRLASVTLRF
jgi:membrane protease YdiL (CAAX protease family)